MSPALEKRLLQCAMVAALVMPVSGAVAGILEGAEWLHRDVTGRDLDSHFRYLSGLLLAMSLLLASCVPDVERKTARLRLLATFPVVGGLARLLALVEHGGPGPGHLLALFLELGVVPMLVLWQARVARRFS